MICEQCGTENLDNASSCKNCGKIFKENSKIVNTLDTQFDDNVQIQNTEASNQKKYINIFYTSILLSFLPTPLSFLGFFVAIITITIAKIKYPNNTTIKVMFWITIVTVIIGIIAITFLIQSCVNSISSCPG